MAQAQPSTGMSMFVARHCGWTIAPAANRKLMSGL
jgi:hypothetical protein